LSATLGLDDSAYRQGIQNVQSETKKTVSSLSGEYSKAAKAVVELTRRYNESVGKTGKASSETKNLKTMLAQAEAQLRATTTALKAANNGMEGFANSTDKASGKSLASAITQGTVMANVFSKLGSAALSAAEGFISSGIEYNAQIEKYTTGFTNMLGSAEAAQQVMSQIQEDAAKTPFDVASLTQANQYLISAGENASYARNTIMALGDAVSATGGGNDELNRMAQNLQQIANTGKATAVDIKQFAYAGIDVYGILADYTGKSTAEVQNMTISYDLLTQALQAASEEGGRYYNSMDTQSQTMNGRVSTLQDNVKQLAGLLTGDLSGGIGVVIGNLNDMLVAAQEAYKTDGWIGLAGAITGLTEPINTAKNALKDFASKATTWLDQLSYKLNRFLGKAATADFDTYEEYADANNRQSNKNRLRQNALKGIGISNKSWSERQAELAAAAGNGGSSITTSPSGSTGIRPGSSRRRTSMTAVPLALSSMSLRTACGHLAERERTARIVSVKLMRPRT
jgi:tape measure domain-containing protein